MLLRAIENAVASGFVVGPRCVHLAGVSYDLI